MASKDRAAELTAALEQVRNDQKEAAVFLENPKAYLEMKGVSTEGLVISPVGESGELSDNQLEQVAGGLTVCTSTGVSTGVGVVACTSVGETKNC